MKKKTILSLGLAVMFTATMMVGCGKEGKVSESEVHTIASVANTDEALEVLKSGNKRFVEGDMKNLDLGPERREHLADGQSPHTIVVACSDSRVTPEHVFDQGLGDLFVIRVAGNILSEEEIGSIEYAVDHLDSPLVVLMGHESCGAVTAAVDASSGEGGNSTKNIDAILNRIEPAVVKAKESDENLAGKELVEKSIDENISLALSNLTDNSELVVDKMKDGNLKIIGAKYKLDTGKVEFDEFYKLD